MNVNTPQAYGLRTSGIGNSLGLDVNKSLLMVSRAGAWKAEASEREQSSQAASDVVFQRSLPGAHATNAHVALRLKAYT
jgi:hypothetical protein